MGAHLNGVQGVAGSNPVVPTSKKPNDEKALGEKLKAFSFGLKLYG